MNLVFAMLHNAATGRYHPILFYESPLPSSDGSEKMQRYKSKGHHTVGFSTRYEAIQCIEDDEERYPGAKMCLAKDFSWDGLDIPAMVVFFVASETGMVPAF
jgi:hypothetical protein